MKKKYFELMREGFAELADGLNLGDEVIEAALYTTEIKDVGQIRKENKKILKWMENSLKNKKISEWKVIFLRLNDYLREIEKEPNLETFNEFMDYITLEYEKTTLRFLFGLIDKNEFKKYSEAIIKLKHLSANLFDLSRIRKNGALCDGNEIFTVDNIDYKLLKTELSHRITDLLGLDKDPSVSEFYDLIGYLIFGLNQDPDRMDNLYKLGKLRMENASPEDIRRLEEEIKSRVPDYDFLYSNLYHADAAFILGKLKEKYCNGVVEIAANALKNPNVDFSDPRNFLNSILNNYE